MRILRIVRTNDLATADADCPPRSGRNEGGFDVSITAPCVCIAHGAVGKDPFMATQSGIAADVIQPLEDTPPVTPTVTHYQQRASDFMRALDEIAGIIPDLEAAHVTTASFVKTHQNVPNQFLATVVAAVEQTEELRSVRKLDVIEGRDTLQFMEAFRPVLDKVTAFAKNLEFTLKSRKATLALDALQIYAIARGLARDANSAAVASLVGNMQRDLGKRGRPKIAVAVRKALRAAEAAAAGPPATWPDAPGGKAS